MFQPTELIGYTEYVPSHVNMYCKGIEDEQVEHFCPLVSGDNDC